MKKIWIGLRKWDKKVVYSAINSGIDALFVPNGYFKTISEIGNITVISKDGNLIPGIDVKFFSVSSSKQINKIVDLNNNCTIILECKNWKIIPIENIIAKKGRNIILSVKTLNETLTAFNILEKGILGVYLRINNFLDLKSFLLRFSTFNKKINLRIGVVESVKEIGIGDRVCIDTCNMLNYGEGVLVGNSSTFFFLIHAENINNLYIPKRPFRVNAGPVHSYIINKNDKTSYLSEISSGDEICVVNYKGNVKKTVVGRVKVERRPLCLLRVVCDGYVGTTILQNAETIRLVLANGGFKSILEIFSGNEILIHIGTKARHFGHKIEEFISEK